MGRLSFSELKKLVSFEACGALQHGFATIRQAVQAKSRHFLLSSDVSLRLNPECKLLAILYGKARSPKPPEQFEETMKVDILCEGKIIGHSDLDPTDPPMGVAEGRFIPAPDYDPSLHAYVIDGDDNELGRGAKIFVRSDEHGMLACAGVVIEDYNEALQEINLTVLGIPYPEYETIFRAYAAYKAYRQIED